MPPARDSRVQRHQEVLARWPVLNEAWAQRIAKDHAPPPAREAGSRDPEGISLLQAINRATGLPDDHGGDAVAQARGQSSGTPEATSDDA